MSKAIKCDACGAMTPKSIFKNGWIEVKTDDADDLDFCSKHCLVTYFERDAK